MSPSPFSHWAGSRAPKAILVGEAFGREEESASAPFVGYAGKELWLMLGEAFAEIEPEEHLRVAQLHRFGNSWIKQRDSWLKSAGLAFTNVFNFRPPENQIPALCVSKKEAEQLAPGYSWPAVAFGKYIHPQWLPEVERLHDEILAIKPNLIVPLGNTACWAILRAINIGQIRGTISQSQSLGIKVLPTYHPQAINYKWDLRPIAVSDLMKARRELEYPEIRRPQRSVIINPTIHEVQTWAYSATSLRPALLSCDIETHGGQISCVGFARARDDALVIPFIDVRRNCSYWETHALERLAWDCVKQLLESGIPLLFQNGVYDLQYLMKMGFAPKCVAEDTMLLHHSIYPELQKGLGFLGSIYTSEPAWKLMRSHKPDTEKRDE